MRNIQGVFFCLLVVLATSFVDAQSNSSQSSIADLLPIDSSIRMGILPNGLHYYLQHNAKPENRAELRLAIKAGSTQEDDNQRGLAHFVEHMAFNGTAHFAKNELINYLESIGARFGADLNAYTSFDETVYILQARTDSLYLLKKGLLILEDWGSGLSFDSLEVDKERGVVISEWRTSLSPDQRLQQQYFPVLYKGSRYAERMPIGDPEIIRTASVNSIKQFYKDWYRPDLMAVVAVGDFDVDWMEKEIIARFSKIKGPANPRKRATYSIPSHDSTFYTIATDKEVPFTQVRILYKHPAEKVSTIGDLKASITRSLYNRILNARMVEVQQQADPPFTFAYSGYGSDLGDIDMYQMYAFVKEGGALRGIETVMIETQRAVQHGFTQTELDRKKNEVLKSIEKAYRERDKTASANLSSRLVYHFLENNPIPGPKHTLELYQKLLPEITLEDINALPKKWINDNNRVFIVTGPEDAKESLPKEVELAELLKLVEKKPLAPYLDKVPDAPLLGEELTPGKILSETIIDSLGIQEIQLDNGVKVVLKSTDFKNDEILMTAYSPGGNSLYSDDDYPSASHAASITDQAGLGDFTLFELQKKLSGKMVNVGPYIGELFEGISGNSSPEDLETLFQLIYLYFTHPRIDTAGFQSYVQRQESIFENIMANPYNSFAEAKNRIKYKDHARRQITTLEDLKKISMDRVVDIYRDRFADASDFTFFFVGNFAQEQIKPLLTKYLANLPSTQRKENWKDVGAALTPGVIDTTMYKGEAPKALVELVFHGAFAPEIDNRYAFSSMISLLRIKMRESMREELGGVYGVRLSGNLNYFPKSTYRITLSFNCEPDQVDTLTHTALTEIGNLKAEGAALEDLNKVTESQKQSRIKGLKENNYWLGQLSYRYQYGLPLEGIKIEALQTKIDALTPGMIQEAANHYFDDGNFMKFVLLPEG
ncbi:MAG: zinc protease [Saprospiraceae bacterium]|nr:MAG: zinc protease [Saprospiraceae bacterium]